MITNTCKNCKHYTPEDFNSSKGHCDKIEVFMNDNYDQVEACSNDLGEVAYVGENFGCIHFEKSMQ